MSDVFSPMSPAARVAQLDAYLDHLHARNGAPDLATGQLPARERLLAPLLAGAPAWGGEVPVEALDRLMQPDARPGPNEPAAALWMAIAAQVNVGEEYGVRAILARQTTPGPVDATTFIELEELYHTRMLLDAVRLFGVKVDLPPPRPSLRFFLHVVAVLPRPVANVLLLAAECNGIALFLGLREKAASLFGVDNEVGRRIQALLGEILIDELGHVAFLRARLGPVRLFVSSVLSRLIARGLFEAIPANGKLFDLDVLVRDVHALSWDRIPADIRARAFNPWGDGAQQDRPAA